MEVGLHICTFDWGDPAATRFHARPDRRQGNAGFLYVTTMDHFMQAEGFMPPHDPSIQGYTGASFIAAHTERVKLGMLVTGVLFRIRACWPRPSRPSAQPDYQPLPRLTARSH